ncbi:hypothetical protein GCM10010358_57230 [Streptomyces minutiscleroticus]|uniref:CchlO n=2 Tax=Streptomyces minutiscleroticus TaxID=68238 RepID=A0A918NU29_9ACTN|nr:hypothetical protein GCM10010358_57230 [Streptomyces minutiscleroticus]
MRWAMVDMTSETVRAADRAGRGGRRAPVVAVLSLLLAGCLAAGCAAKGPADDGRAGASHGGGGAPRNAPPGGHPPQDPQGAGGPARGAAGPVLAVKIDNVAGARPQTGLDKADVVYVEQVEGGLSRLLAVYATMLPEAVGPVRSARESDLELLRQFDGPRLAYSGAQRAVTRLIEQAPLAARTPESAPGSYYRSADRPSPHNLYLRPQRLMGTAPGAHALTTGFRYGKAPAGGTPAATRTVRFPAARFTFAWSAAKRRWLVSMDGTPTVTTDGARVGASTVVLQYVKVRRSQLQDSRGSFTPYTETVGSGAAKVLRDGRVYDVGWRRPGAAEGTRFTTADGRPVNFAEGPVWVVLAQG